MIKSPGKFHMMLVGHQLNIPGGRLRHAACKAHGMIHEDIDHGNIQLVAYRFIKGTHAVVTNSSLHRPAAEAHHCSGIKTGNIWHQCLMPHSLKLDVQLIHKMI